jgi:YggT family protein
MVPTQVIAFLIYFIGIFAQIVTFLIFARVILSWIPTQSNRLTEFIIGATEPIMAPMRKIIPNIGPIDISPIVTLFLIGFVSDILIYFLTSL